MRISDWSSDVCSSDLGGVRGALLNEMLRGANTRGQGPGRQARAIERAAWIEIGAGKPQRGRDIAEEVEKVGSVVGDDLVAAVKGAESRLERPGSDERRVGKECVSTCRSRWSPYNEKNNRKTT